jgi:hypothetical protein
MVGDNPDPSVVAQVVIFKGCTLVNLFKLLRKSAKSYQTLTLRL